MSGLKVLIRGAGEHASATAHRLFRCRMRVAMTEVQQPTAVAKTGSAACLKCHNPTYCAVCHVTGKPPANTP